MKLKLSVLTSLILLSVNLQRSEVNVKVETNIRDNVKVNSDKTAEKFSVNNFLYIQYFDGQNIKDKQNVSKLLHGYIPIDGTRIINTDTTQIYASILGEKVITNELYIDVARNLGKPLFINDIFYGIIRNVRLNEDNKLEYTLDKSTSFYRIYTTDGSDEFWKKDFNIKNRYIKNLYYPKEQKELWETHLLGYYPIEGSRFIPSNKFEIREDLENKTIITNEKILANEMIKNTNKPIFIDGIYKGIILTILNHNNRKTIYIVKEAEKIEEIYEITPKMSLNILDYKERTEKALEKELESYHVDKEKYENLHIGYVDKIHFDVLTNTIGFIPEIGSRFISTKQTNIISQQDINENSFIVTDEMLIQNMKKNIDKPLFINGIYYGVIKDITTTKANETIYRLQNMAGKKHTLYLGDKNKIDNISKEDKNIKEIENILKF